MHLLPQQPCHWCSAPTRQALCEACTRQLQQDTARCQQCALPLQFPVPLCGECLSTPPPFSRIVCAADHSYPFAHWLNHFKHERDLVSGNLLVERLLTDIKAHPGTVDWLIPTPLHWYTQWRRGFNPSAWIASRLSQALAIPTLNALQRPHLGGAQKDLTRQQRLRNLRGTFRLRSQRAAALKGASVVLIDDVVTTGATARVLSKLLSKAGAVNVEVWCLTRTPKKG